MDKFNYDNFMGIVKKYDISADERKTIVEHLNDIPPQKDSILQTIAKVIMNKKVFHGYRLDKYSISDTAIIKVKIFSPELIIPYHILSKHVFTLEDISMELVAKRLAKENNILLNQYTEHTTSNNTPTLCKFYDNPTRTFEENLDGVIKAQTSLNTILKKEYEHKNSKINAEVERLYEHLSS